MDKYIDEDIAKTLIQTRAIGKVDYGNDLLYGINKKLNENGNKKKIPSQLQSLLAKNIEGWVEVVYFSLKLKSQTLVSLAVSEDKKEQEAYHKVLK